jgi:cell division protein FtsW (lipid II flippase)
MLGLSAGIDRRLVYNLDWVLLGTSLLLSLLGAAMVYSATQAGSQPGLYLKQLTLVGVGVVAMALAAAIDYRRLADRAVLLYVLSVLALVYVLRFAPVIAGTRRWIVIAGFQLQPSSSSSWRQPSSRPRSSPSTGRSRSGSRTWRCRAWRWACCRC